MKHILRVSLFVLFVTVVHAQSWIQTNGPAGADVRAIAIDSSHHVYVGTQGGGVFKSTDNGNTWTAMNNGLTAKDVHDIVVTPNGNLFAGTFAGGVFRSIDGGLSWTQVNNGLEMLFIEDLAVNSSGHLFAGTWEGGGVYRSIDNGDNWTLQINGITNTYVTAVTVNAGDTLYAGTWGSGVFRSVDNGDTWTAQSSGMLSANPAVVAFGINANGDLFAGMDFGEGIYKSVDGGENWTLLSIATGNNVYAIEADASGTLYAGTYGDGVFTSSNNGDSWTPINNGLANQYVLSMAMDSAGTILAGTYFGGGVFRSSDNGMNWFESNTGLIATQVTALAVNQNTYDIFAGTYGIGLYRSENHGNTWEKINNGIDARYIRAIAINQDGDIFAGADWVNGQGGVFRSMDNGDTWSQVSNIAMQDYDVRALSINSNGHIFAATYNTGGVWVSTDNGDTWNQMNNGISCASLWSFAIDSNNNLFAGSAGCNTGVFRSTDNAQNWDTASVGMTYTDIQALTINSDNVLFAGGTMFGGSMYRSTDNADSWTAINNGLPPDPNTQALVIDSADRVYAGLSNGAYLTTDNGDTWTAINTGLTAPDVRSLAYTSAGYVLAGTSGGGVFLWMLPEAMPIAMFGSADQTICPNSCVQFENQSIGATTYQWTFAEGTPNTSTDASPTVCYPTTGTYDVILITTNANGSDTATMPGYVIVNAVPAPSITQAGNWLNAELGFASYQWLLNGNSITGADSSSYNVTQDGVYSVLVADADGCEGTSDTINVIITGISYSDHDSSIVSIYPNPTNALVNISSSQPIVSIELSDVLGRRFIYEAKGVLNMAVPTDPFAKGLYTITVRSGNQIDKRKLVVH